MTEDDRKNVAMTTKEELQAEAEKVFPMPKENYGIDAELNAAMQHGYVRAKTVSAEQLERAAKELYERLHDGDVEWEQVTGHFRLVCLDDAAFAFRAAGFYVENYENTAAE